MVAAEMEPEILPDFAAQNSILKRKRTKRQRPDQSPILFGAIVNSSSEDDDARCNISRMPTSSLDVEVLQSDLEMMEDHEVAMCLILLARGGFKRELKLQVISDRRIEMSSSSRKCVEGKVSDGVYECKTCNRVFHSFQALGGHRASHKKLKITDEEELVHKAPIEGAPDNDRTRSLVLQNISLDSPPIVPLPLGNNRAARKVRVHECLTCGAEFASGQALGGHMRRHRVTIAVNPSVATETFTDTRSSQQTLSLLSPFTIETEEIMTGNDTRRSANQLLSLDLNCPASDDEIEESKFSFISMQQQQQQQPKELQNSGLVFSTPASTMILSRHILLAPPSPIIRLEFI